MSKITVMCVDDSALMRQLMTEIINSQPAMEVVATAPDPLVARELIKRLEDMTVAAAGRLYFAKDSLARGSDVRAMYPEHEDWLRAVTQADPEARLMTDMIRRLKLRSRA